MMQSCCQGDHRVVVEDANLISGKGLGHIFDFAFTLSARLLEDDIPVRDRADHIDYPW